MQNYRFKISLLVLVAATIYASCRKTDSQFERTAADNTKADLTARFFTAKPGTHIAATRVLEEIRQRDNNLHFISDFALTNGLAQWDKAIVTLPENDPSHNFGNNVQNGDTIVYIPLVLTNTQYTNGFIRAVLNDTISISNWVAGDYRYFPVSAAAGETSRNQYASMIMLMDNQVFGATKFKLTDSSLLLPAGSAATGHERLAKITSIDTVSGSNLCTGTIYTVSWLVQDAANCSCTNGASSPGGHCSDWQTGCAACSNTVSITIQVGDGGCGGGVSTPPSPTNPTGGSSGGTWNTGPVGGGGSGGGPVGWVPIVLFEPYECTYQMTPHEISIFNQLDQEDAEADLQYHNLDCKGTKMSGGNIAYSGTLQHWIIQLDYMSKNPAFGEREFAIPHSGTNARGYADIANLLNGNIFEIKPDDANYYVSGINEVSNYVAKANTYCTSTLPPGVVWNRGSVYPTTYLPTHLPNRYLKARLMAPGLIGYSYENTANPPNPPPIAIPASILDKLRTLIKRLKQNIADADRIISEFLQQHPEVVTFIKAMAVGAGVAIIVGTLVEDVITAGAGILDDWASFQLAYRIIRFGLAL